MKITFIGDTGVGKTQIINTFFTLTSPPPIEKTIGVDFLCKQFQLNEKNTVKLQLWDTSGQEKFRSLIFSYIRDSQAIVLVYDINNRISFLDLEGWFEIVKTVDQKIIKIVIGNKFEQITQREVSEEEAVKFSQKIDASFMEINGKNYADIFRNIVVKVKQQEKKIILKTQKTLHQAKMIFLKNLKFRMKLMRNVQN